MPQLTVVDKFHEDKILKTNPIVTGVKKKTKNMTKKSTQVN